MPFCWVNKKPVNPMALSNTLFPRLLEEGRRIGATDLHLVEGGEPVFRLARTFRETSNLGLARETVGAFASLYQALFDEDADSKNTKSGFTFGDYRVRAIGYRTNGRRAITFRFIPAAVPRLRDLGYEDALADYLCVISPGLVLFSGGPCAGKSTSQAATLDYLNHHNSLHIRTFEDPIEYALASDRSLVTQQIVGEDVEDYHTGVALALMQDVNVMAFGEINSLDTLRAALKAANLNMLVFATVHAEDVASTVIRLLNEYPESDRREAARQLARCLKLILAQKLIPNPAANQRLGLAPVTLGYQAAVFRKEKGGYGRGNEVSRWGNLIMEGRIHELSERFAKRTAQDYETLFQVDSFIYG